MSEMDTSLLDLNRKRNNCELDRQNGSSGDSGSNDDEEQKLSVAAVHSVDSNDEDSLPPTKRNKLNVDYGDADGEQSGKIEVRFLVSSRDAGAIIGRAGSNITHLRQVYDASITVPDCPSPERVLTINASVEKVVKIVQDILEFIETLRVAKPNQPLKSKKPDKDPLKSGPNETEFRLLLHTSHAGGLIGKGGSRITQLRDETKASIKIFSDYCPQSSERVCAITGSNEVVANAIRTILCLIKTLPTRGSVVAYNPRNYDAFNAARYGGFSETAPGVPVGTTPTSTVPASGSGTSFGGRASFYPTPPIPPPPAPHYSHPPPPPPPSSHHPHHAYATSNRIPTIADTAMVDSNSSSDYPVSFFPPWSSGSGFRMNFGRNDITDTYASDAPWFAGSKNWQAKTSNTLLHRSDLSLINNPDGTATATITVSNKIVGAIIGKGGHRIKEIRTKSKAEISVGQNSATSNNRIITVKGFVQAVQAACQMICKCIDEN